MIWVWWNAMSLSFCLFTYLFLHSIYYRDIFLPNTKLFIKMIIDCLVAHITSLKYTIQYILVDFHNCYNNNNNNKNLYSYSKYTNINYNSLYTTR